MISVQARTPEEARPRSRMSTRVLAAEWFMNSSCGSDRPPAPGSWNSQLWQRRQYGCGAVCSSQPQNRMAATANVRTIVTKSSISTYSSGRCATRISPAPKSTAGVSPIFAMSPMSAP